MMNIDKWLKYLSLLGSTTLLSTGAAELWGLQSAQAQTIRSFAPRYQTQTKGNMSIIGNTLMTCDSTTGKLNASQCSGVQSGNPTNAANNNFFMKYVDIDSNGSTFNSSSSQLVTPVGATVVWAGLYWSGDLSAGTSGVAAQNSSLNNQALLQTPNGSQTITATNIDKSGNRYSAYADVTSLVKAAGNGDYTMANVQAGTGGDRYAGWSLIVAYEDPSEKLRSINVFDGFVIVSGSNTVSTTVSGFETPPSAGFEVNLGVVASEGDLSILGDQFKVNGLNLTNGLNPATNFFNSSNTRLGSRFTAKNPNYVNELAIDIDTIDATGFLAPSSTSASLQFISTGDAYFPSVLTFATEIKQPVLTRNFTKTVTDLNGGQAIAGDIFEYEITLENTGNETASNVIISDPIPNNTTLVNGSLTVVQSPNSSDIGTKTNVSGDDTSELNGTNVVFRVGNGSSTSNGGNLAPNESVKVKFQVKVNPQLTAASNISNQASVNFNNAGSGTAFNGVSNDPSTPQQNDATGIQVAIKTSDYGDAPALYGDAIHDIPTTPTVYLGGIKPDQELGTQLGNDAGASAAGDDGNGTDDEDAFTTLANVPNAGNYSLNVPVTNTSGGDATLHAWVDFNKDGKFEEGEYKSAAVIDGATSANLSWAVPSGITPGNTYVRFRLTTTALTDNTTTTNQDERSLGAANDGEVEDYQIAIAQPVASDPNLLLVKRITAINPGKPDEIQFNNFVDDSTLSDNNPKWPDSDGNPSNNINTYLRGATNVPDVKPRDEVEYTIYFLSNGDVAAKNIQICDVVPDNMTFNKNSYGTEVGIGLALNATTLPTSINTYLSNLIDSDEGSFYAPGTNPPVVNLCKKHDPNNANILIPVDSSNNLSGAVLINLSTPIPPATTPGTPTNSYGFIRFRAKVK